MDGRPLRDLTGFQRDLLTLLADVEEPSGRDVKQTIESEYGEDLNNGQIYPNLDALVDAGLADKQEVDGRQNAYSMTETGEEALLADLEWRVSAVED